MPPPSVICLRKIYKIEKIDKTLSSDWAVVSENNGGSTPLHRVRCGYIFESNATEHMILAFQHDFGVPKWSVFQVPIEGPGVTSSVFFLSPGREAAETLCGGF